MKNRSIQSYLSIFALSVALLMSCVSREAGPQGHAFNGPYTGRHLDRIAFPVGGIGAGMVCFEGTGSVSQVSVYNEPNLVDGPLMFAAVWVKDAEKGAKVLEGPVPDWRIFGVPRKSLGASRSGIGLPRFDHAEFVARFPFASLRLQDEDVPLEVMVTAWSPFIPSDEDNSSLPCGGLEYTFENRADTLVEGVFSYNSTNFMKKPGCVNRIVSFENGFVLSNDGGSANPHLNGDFAIFTDEPSAVIDHCWYRGGHFDSETMIWNNVKRGTLRPVPPVEKNAPGASLSIPFTLLPGQKRTFRVMFAWYVPESEVRSGKDLPTENASGLTTATEDVVSYHRPWYSGRFANIGEVGNYFRTHYDTLRTTSALFRDTFFESTLPDAVLEAVSANLSLMKTPTILRQRDGRLWGWEGCRELVGCCAGTSTHVWNYAQAIPHLFPRLERTLRETEFKENQNPDGRQIFRAGLPIRPVLHDYYAAADGQLGGIMKFYRDWRISGDDEWMKLWYPSVKQSMDFCIAFWDPERTGILQEPQHNTFDINFLGPNGMCSSFYLGALKAMIALGDYVGDDTGEYAALLERGVTAMESELFNGEYFIQKIPHGNSERTLLQSAKPGTYPELVELLQKEGPRYQYGDGCLANGVAGTWLAAMCGIDEPIVNPDKVKSHYEAVFRYNFFDDLSDHANPQRPAFAMKNDGGLVLCTWPKSERPSLPFSYSDEIWTGIEYQVASHMIRLGQVEEGLKIVSTTRKRYDGAVRNPFDEFECGHFYARAMSSYALLQGLTGVRYDAVEKTLFIDSRMGDNFTSFFAAEDAWGHVGLRKGKPFVDLKYGELEIARVSVSGKDVPLTPTSASSPVAAR